MGDSMTDHLPVISHLQGANINGSFVMGEKHSSGGRRCILTGLITQHRKCSGQGGKKPA